MMELIRKISAGDILNADGGCWLRTPVDYMRRTTWMLERAGMHRGE
jgi:hypothetical protein